MRFHPLLIVTTLFCSFLSNAQVNLSQSLSACYSLNGNASEPINNLTGTLSAVTATVDRFNNANSAMSFAGNPSSYIRLPNNPLIKPNSISIAGWVRTNMLANQYIAFTTNGCASYFEGYAFAIFNPGGGFRFHISKSNGCGSINQISINSNQIVAANTWYHVGFYAGPDSLKIYVNGNLDIAVTNTNSLLYDLTANVYLGGTNLGYNSPFFGTMDNVRFYNRKLNNAEMQQLYNLDPSCAGPPVASFSVSSSTVCSAKTLTLTDMSTNAPNAWNWQTPGASTSSFSVSNPTLTFPQPGIYTISLVSSNSVGVSNMATQAVTVIPSPTITVSNSPVCIGQNATLTASGASAYNWSTGHNGPTLIVGPGINSSYTVVGTGTNACVTSSQINMTVVPLPTISISGNTIVCPGQSATLTASGTAQSYTWSNGFVGSQMSFTPFVSGDYTVTGSDSHGCKNSTVRSVSMHALPAISISGNGTVCEGSPTSLLAGGSAITFTWSNGFIGNLVTVSPTISTNYTVTGMGVNGCLNTATQLVFVNGLPSIFINANNTSVCMGDGVVLSANGASTYSWSGAVVNNLMFYPSTTATYSVTGTGTNSCKKTATIQVIVQPLPTVSIISDPAFAVCSGEPVSLTASGANIYNWNPSGGSQAGAIVFPTVSTTYTLTGTDANGCSAKVTVLVNVEECLSLNSNHITNRLIIYPNPASNIFVLSLAKGLTPEVRSSFILRNALSQIIIQKEISTPETSLDVSGFSKGIYFLSIYDDGRLTGIEKIVVE